MKDKYIIYFISRTKANMIKFIENKLKENDLTELIPTHGNILTALYESDKKLTMKEIAQKIGKDKSTVTPLVNKLIRLGYIEKEKSITDKRVTYISLTAKARDIEDRFNFISLLLISIEISFLFIMSFSLKKAFITLLFLYQRIR